MAKKDTETKSLALVTNTPRELVIQEIQTSLKRRIEESSYELISRSFTELQQSLINASSVFYNVGPCQIKEFQPSMLKELGTILLSKAKKVVWLRRFCYSAVASSLAIPVSTLVWALSLPQTSMALRAVSAVLSVIAILAYVVAALYDGIENEKAPLSSVVDFLTGTDTGQLDYLKKCSKSLTLLRRFKTEDQIYEELHRRLK